jgi:hypothetical protein
MSRPDNKAILAIALLVGSVLFFPGCAEEKKPKGKVIATVNGEYIYADGLKREIARQKSLNPNFRITPSVLNELVDVMINKKLIIQEAMKKELPKNDKFINTIETFWEQTLIRDFIEYKNSQLGAIEVTQGDLEDYHKNLTTEVTLNVSRTSSEEKMNEMINQYENQGNLDWDQTVTLRYNDIESDMMAKAFEMETGETKVFATPGVYWFIHMAKKEPVVLPPLDEIKDQVREAVTLKKQQQEFTKWLNKKKRGSDIEINIGALKGITN